MGDSSFKYIFNWVSWLCWGSQSAYILLLSHFIESLGLVGLGQCLSMLTVD